jgi:hypothetical protein
MALTRAILRIVLGVSFDHHAGTLFLNTLLINAPFVVCG